MKTYLSSMHIMTVTQRYNTPDTSRIEETSFTQDTEQWVVSLRQMVQRDHIVKLYRYLDVDPGNVDLINTDLFKVEKSKSGATELSLFNGENLGLSHKQVNQKVPSKKCITKQVWRHWKNEESLVYWRRCTSSWSTVYCCKEAARTVISYYSKISHLLQSKYMLWQGK